MNSHGNGHLFDVSCSGIALAQLRRLKQLAKEKGNLKDFLTALRALYDRLRRDPKKLGDPAYRLPRLKLFVYIAAVPPFIIHYGIHDEQPLVFIKWVYMLSN